VKQIVIVVLSLFFVQPQIASAESNSDMKDKFVHPFLAHMALPDRTNEVSLRISPYQRRLGAVTVSDIAFHVEAGLVRDVGLHVRAMD